ncbi:MAG: hypothetical protein WC938_00095 [Candidatus Paceibacterota bacterium]|jgi:hypothetical protein
MSNKRPIEQHSDDGFIQGFEKYFLIDTILKSNSWDELVSNIEKLKVKFPWESLLFKEFKFYNLLKKVEQNISDLLITFLIENNFINKSHEDIKKYLFDRIKQYRKDGAISEAMNEIEEKLKECKDENCKLKRLLNPDCLFYISGRYLGDLIYIIREYTNDFEDKTELLEKLNNFNDARTDIIHNSLTSRGEGLSEIIDNGLILGKEILEIIDLLPEDVNNSKNNEECPFCKHKIGHHQKIELEKDGSKEIAYKCKEKECPCIKIGEW